MNLFLFCFLKPGIVISSLFSNFDKSIYWKTHAITLLLINNRLLTANLCVGSAFSDAEMKCKGERYFLIHITLAMENLKPLLAFYLPADNICIISMFATQALYFKKWS